LVQSWVYGKSELKDLFDVNHDGLS
jgi:hypothetical protein